MWCLGNVTQCIEETDCNLLFVIVTGGLLSRAVVLLEFRELKIFFSSRNSLAMAGKGKLGARITRTLSTVCN